MTRIAGSTALVTGASSGIGRATALALAERGARLLLTGRDRAALDEVAARTGGDARAADLAEPEAAERLAGWAREQGPPGIVVHAAGIGLAGPARDGSAEQARTLLEVNLVAPMRLTVTLLPHPGHLVFVTSIAGLLGVPEEAAYAASKAALEVYAASLAAELAPQVRVTRVVPGVVDTAFFARRGRPYDRRFPRPVPADRVARAVVGAVERDRARVVVPGWLRVPVALQAAAPTTYHRLANRLSR